MEDNRQQQLIADFFKDFHSWSASNIGMWIGAGFAEFFLGVFMWIPYQDMAEDNFIGLMFLVAFWGAWLYILPYVSYYIAGKQYKIYDKLKYFPVSLQQLRIFRIKKLLRFCLIALGIFLVGQLLFAYIGYGRIELCNILYPVVGGFLLPFGVSALGCLVEK